MNIGLGIDTGGTYTDAVLMDFATGDVLASDKAPTTHDRLSVGIHAALSGLPGELLARVSMAALSTTLATNACVEDRGCRVALFLLGYRAELVERLREDYGLHEIEIVHVAGAHGQKGQVVEEPDWAALERLAREVAPRVDALGVVEYWGVRNPEYEREAQRRLAAATSLPVAAAHELTDEINSMRRAATTALNARLIPLLGGLLEAVSRSLASFHIDAPLMIVRGDGSLMTEAFARAHPVETLLSGPAASVIGGLALADERDAILVDIGGTTTDLAIVRDGSPVLTRDGVDVGRWRTGTRAIAIRTTGLGGDSSVSLSKQGKLTLGPRRAIPLCALASEHEGVEDTLHRMLTDDVLRSYSRGEFLVRRSDGAGLALSSLERAVLDALADGPLTVERVCERVGSRPYFLDTQRLEFLGVVIRSTLTPTDIMHVVGTYAAWNARAARYGAQLLADQIGTSVDELCDRIFEMASERLYRLVCDHLLTRALAPRRVAPDGDALLGLGYAPQGDEVAIDVRSSLPLVGLGAPTHLFLPRAAQALHAPHVVPPRAGVANAVGAISGSVCAEESVSVKPIYNASGIEGYTGHSSAGYAPFDAYDDAIAWATAEADRLVRIKADAQGAVTPNVVIETLESGGQTGGDTAQWLFLETRIVARAMGKAAFAREA